MNLLFSRIYKRLRSENKVEQPVMSEAMEEVNEIPKRVERRGYYRHEFPHAVVGKLTVAQVGEKKVSLGYSKMLIRDISLGGMKIKSDLNLPIRDSVKYKFIFTLLGEPFELIGQLRWKEKARGETYFYGIEFELCQVEEDHMAPLMNKMSAWSRQQQEFPGMDYVYEDTFVFLMKDRAN